MAELRVIKPGLLTTVQDRGRWGFQSRGVSVAGPMDAYAHRLANALVDNTDDTATLEVTWVGPELEFEDQRVITVSGAEFEVAVDGRSVPPNRALGVAPGSRLTFGRRLRGTRAYVAVAGGIAVAPVFGSRATHLGSRLGGLEGRALKAGDRLPLGAKRGRTPLSVGSARKGVRPLFGTDIRAIPDGHARVRVLPGPHDDYFRTKRPRASGLAVRTRIVSSDRMGFRLKRAAPHATARCRHHLGCDADGRRPRRLPVCPFLLMADRQTTGDIPIAVIADLGLAGQLGPAARFRSPSAHRARRWRAHCPGNARWADRASEAE
jgi:biotin-dependent carboxylase-like uncharacterized protein